MLSHQLPLEGCYNTLACTILKLPASVYSLSFLLFPWKGGDSGVQMVCITVTSTSCSAMCVPGDGGFR